MLVISAKSGQLGNRLLLFANFISFALENNYQVLNPAFEEYAHFFAATSQNLFCSYPQICLPLNIPYLRSKYYLLNRDIYQKSPQWINKINITREKPFNWNDSELVSLINPKKINFFDGWLFRDGWFVQDLPLLQKHSHKIRKYFRPLHKYEQNVTKLMTKLRHEGDIIIGVHIRQGDYEQHQGGRYFYTLAYYVKIMAEIAKLFPQQKVIFLICSNIIQEQNNFTQFNYCFGNNHIIEDMYSLAECDYIIGPPSTYTMWGSFYGEKPLYMIIDVNKAPKKQDFIHFHQWSGIFNYRENWAESYWEWTN